jgi:predicted DNA-binding helix-hairpin-helix protein
MVSIQRAPDVRDKLRILAADAQYALSCACTCATGEPRRRGLDDRWLYPVTLQSGGRGLMFKTLVSNACANDCKYCPLRAGHDATPRCSLAPEEIVRAFLPYWRSGQAIGIFLTSGVAGSPDAAMERCWRQRSGCGAGKASGACCTSRSSRAPRMRPLSARCSWLPGYR